MKIYFGKKNGNTPAAPPLCICTQLSCLPHKSTNVHDVANFESSDPPLVFKKKCDRQKWHEMIWLEGHLSVQLVWLLSTNIQARYSIVKDVPNQKKANLSGIWILLLFKYNKICNVTKLLAYEIQTSFQWTKHGSLHFGWRVSENTGVYFLTADANSAVIEPLLPPPTYTVHRLTYNKSAE